MKNSLLSFILVLAPTSMAWALEQKKPEPIPLVNIEANFGAGYRLFGEQVNVAHDTISPTPDYYVNYFYGGRLTVMPGSFGVQAGYQRNLFRAASFSAGGGYSVYTYDTIDAGVTYMMSIGTSQPDGKRAFLTFGAGLNYSMLQLADQYKSDLQTSANKQGQNITFNPSAATGIGGYIQGGVLFYLNSHLFFSAGLRLNYINAKFSGASQALDNWGFEVPLGIGVSF